MRAIRLPFLVVAALGLGAALTIASDELPLREIAVALFLAIAPGMAVLWLTGITDRVARIALVVPVSLAIDTLLVSITVYLGIWSPELVLVLVALLTAGAVALAPYEWPARAGLVVIGLLPALAILAGELSRAALG